MYFFFDTETGGLTPDYSLLTFSAIIADRNFNVVSVHGLDPGLYLRLRYPRYNTQPRAMAINRINLAEHDAHGFSVPEAREMLLAFVHEACVATGERRLIPAGHNVPFDIQFTQRYLLPQVEWGNHFAHPSLDTCAIARFFKACGLIDCDCRLGAVCEYFGIDIGNAHNAEADSLACLRLAKEFKARMPKQLEQFTSGRANAPA
jgi:DNA polymerase III epsilon subunit-like protein